MKALTIPFDGDAIRCSDQMSMFQSIIDNANKHLQNIVVGRAEEALDTIDGYGHTEWLYAEALKGVKTLKGLHRREGSLESPVEIKRTKR